MKYGALLPEDWDPVVEGYSEGCVAIVLLNNDGTVALDELTYNSAGMEAGTAIIFDHLGNSMRRYFPVPMHITIDRAFNTQMEAFDWSVVREERKRYIAAVEEEVNTQLEVNESIDDLYDRSRWRRQFWQVIAILLVIIAILLVVIVYMLVKRGF